MNEKIYEFQAEIKKVPDIDGAYIEFPYDLREEFGKGRGILRRKGGHSPSMSLNSQETM